LNSKLNPEEIARTILDGDAEKAARLAQEAIQSGKAPLDTLDPFVGAIRQAGDLFDCGEFFLPQLLMSAKAMQAAMDVLFPPDQRGESHVFRGKVVAGTIQGDIHEIGKNLVCALLSANGFEVVDLGADVALDRFIAETKAKQPDLLVLSALLTTTMVNQKNLIDLLVEKNLRHRVKVLVGGAPVTASWAREIGADGYAPDAARAVDTAIQLLETDRA
jgi:corrinoid protein of di/trimethylamine methyltransferase